MSDCLDFNPSLWVDFNLGFNPFLTMHGIMHPDLFEPVSPSIKQDERILTGSLWGLDVAMCGHSLARCLALVSSQKSLINIIDDVT